MRVLHVGKFYPPVDGGMERVLQTLCEGERPRVDSRVLVASRGRRTVHDVVNGVPVTRVGSLGGVGAVQVCPGFPYWLRAARTDLIVVHEPNPVALVSCALARPKAPLVVWFHSDVVRPAWRYRAFYRPFERPVLEGARRIVVSSPTLGVHARALSGLQSKLVVIPFGIDPGRVASRPDTAARVEALRRQHRGPLLLFVGRLVPYKGLDVLIRALLDVPATAVLVGDGPNRLALERLAREVGVADRVVFAGRRSDHEMVAFYQACDVFVLPSVTRAEAFGLVQLEAMAAERPVVSTSVPSGVSWVNQHERTGLVVPPGDAGALASALSRLLQDPSLRVRMGRAGRERVLREFTIAKMIESTTALYSSLIDLESGDRRVAAACER